jgi:membrane fusion protein, multidrug efflux system
MHLISLSEIFLPFECLTKRQAQQLLLAIFALSLSYGCGTQPDTSVQKSQDEIADVTVAQPLVKEVTDWDVYTGRIEAVNSVDVRARVSGYLDKVNFTAGSRVSAGDLLFEIDPQPFRAQLNYADAQLAQAITRQELAKNDLKRAEGLFHAKAISAEEYDARKKGSKEASAAVQSAKANVQSARINLNFTSIRSPINGKIGRELITKGNVVNGGGPDATLLTFIVSTDPVYVYVEIDERSALKYRRLAQNGNNASAKATPVELALADEPGFPHKGVLDYTSPRVDVATGTVTMRGVFSNPNDLLSPGFFARMRIKASPPYPAIMLPDRTVSTDQAQRYVWVINSEDKAEYRKVTLGAQTGGLRVITQGLKASEWVVTEGVQKLKANSKVNPKRITLASSEGD